MTNTSQSDNYAKKELKLCRYQLIQAERRATAACESRDALVLQLENATDTVAELQRTLNVANHQRETLANETAAKEVDLAAGEKQRSELEVTLNISRINIGKIKEKLKKAQLEAEAQTKSTTLVEAALVKEKENCNKLQRELVGMTEKQSSILTKYNESKETAASLAKEAQTAAAQIRNLETKLAACESELQLAKREAAESRKAKQAYKNAVLDNQNTKKEMRHLGMELLREQGALEEQAEQHSTQALVRSRRAEQKDNNSEIASSVVDEEISRKVSVLQRRLIAEKEAAAKVAAALGQKEDEVIKLKKSLERERTKEENASKAR